VLASARRGVLQTTFHVLVASRSDRVREGVADIWDSGVITSPDPWVLYGGRTLTSRTRYFWTVRVSAAAGESSAWAPMTWFETATRGRAMRS
jgi:alpha-L-rhamnosidase